MSDSEHSTVTYTSISSDYEEPSDVGSPGVVVYGYDGLPMHPPSPDYVLGPEHPPSPVYVPYVPEPAYPEFMPPEDDVFPAEEQPLPAAVSPTADSPGYITESDPKEDLEEDDDEDPEEDPADYPTDRDDDDEEEESSEDDVDGKEEEKAMTRRRWSPTHPLGYRAAMIQLRAESPSTSHLLPLLPPIVLPRTRASMVLMRAAAPSTYILAPRSRTPPSGTPPLGTPPLLPIPLPTSSPPLLLLGKLIQKLLLNQKCMGYLAHACYAEEQPLPAAVSPTTNSPGYIIESDPKEDLEEEDDEDPTDYPADRDDEDEESSGDDTDDEKEDEGEDENEEKHLAPADSVPPPAYCTTVRIPTDAGAPLGYKAAMIWLRAESPSTSHPLPPSIVLLHTRASMVMMRAATPSTYILAPRSGILPSRTPPSGTPPLLPIPLPTVSPPLLLPFTNCRAEVPEVTLSPQKRLCIAPGPRYEIRKCSSAPTARPTRGFRADYGFVDEIADEIPATDVAELGQRMTDFVTTVRQDTDEIYERLDDAQDDRLLMSGQLNLLRRDRRSYARTARLMESEARASHEAWVQSMDASDMAHSKTQIVALQSQQRLARDPAHPDVSEEAGSSS
ncbi:hypothetical protein Tco_0355358 [Tanacetum coccineum]